MVDISTFKDPRPLVNYSSSEDDEPPLKSSFHPGNLKTNSCLDSTLDNSSNLQPNLKFETMKIDFWHPILVIFSKEI